MRILTAVLVAVLASACATTSTIYRSGAPALEAEVVDADAANVYITDQAGRLYRVPRKDIADIDHPGNVLMVVGAAIVAMGAGMYFTDGSPRDTQEEVRNAHITGIVFAVPGALMATWGGYSWWSSQRTESRHGDVRISAVASVASPADVVVQPPPVPTSSPPAPGSPDAFAPKAPPPAGPGGP